ncbi:MAG: hypothetical protein M3433_02340 [Actinomycetota bacterium]|nr:hypothetical protein [Actinomycetota bacterium]
MDEGPRDSSFLPPEAPGPEPDLGEPQQPQQDATQQLPQTEQTQPYPQQPPPQGWPPPQQGWGQPQGYGSGQPQAYGYGPPPGWQAQPPGGPQQPGWQGHQQPGWQGHQQPGWQGPHQPAWPGPQQQAWPGQPPWQPHAAWATGPKEPDNTPAVVGFSLAMVGGGLLFFFAGLSTIISLGLSIAGIIYSRKGRTRVDEGKTTKHRGLAQAGFIVGIVSTVLSLLATAFWILFVVLLATDDEFRRELDKGNGNIIAIDVSSRLLRGLFSLLS